MQIFHNNLVQKFISVLQIINICEKFCVLVVRNCVSATLLFEGDASRY
jgi:hypothetical protein